MRAKRNPKTSGDAQSILETELIFGVRRRERFAWVVAILGLMVGFAGAASAVMTLPLKETRAFLTIVDKDTGIASRAVEIERASIDHGAAIEQSLVFSYVMDRETFDVDDNEARLLGVYQRSFGEAAQSLKELWNNQSPTYPPTLYGSGAVANVDILNIVPISPDTMQVRFVKTLLTPGEANRVGKFYATVTFEFFPSTDKELKLVWQNPFGFTVTSYRVTSELGAT